MRRAAAAILAARVVSLAIWVADSAPRPLAPSIRVCLGEYGPVLAAYASTLGSESATVRFQRMPGSEEETRPFLDARRALTRSSLYVALGVMVVGAVLDHVQMAVAVALWALGVATTRLSAIAWIMWQSPWRYAVNLTASAVARTVIVLIVVALTHSWEIGFALSGAVSVGLAYALGPRKTSDHCRGSLPPPAYGRALLVAAIATAMSQSVDRVLLPILVEHTRAGIYAAIAIFKTLRSVPL